MKQERKQQAKQSSYPRPSSKKAQTNEERLDPSHVLPTQELKSGRRPYHFSSYTMSFNKQAKRRKNENKCQKMKRGVERQLPNPLEGPLVLCGCLWGSQDSSQPDLIAAKPARFPLLERLHTTTQTWKYFAFLGKKISLEIL